MFLHPSCRNVDNEAKVGKEVCHSTMEQMAVVSLLLLLVTLQKHPLIRFTFLLCSIYSMLQELQQLIPDF